jgi:hypothetical protein
VVPKKFGHRDDTVLTVDASYIKRRSSVDGGQLLSELNRDTRTRMMTILLY